MSKNNRDLRHLQDINKLIDNTVSITNQGTIQRRAHVKEEGRKNKKIITTGAALGVTGVSSINIRRKDNSKYSVRPRLMPNEESEKTENTKNHENRILKED